MTKLEPIGSDLEFEALARASLRERYAARRGAGRVDPADRRPRDAGLGHAEAERRAAAQLPLGIRGRRCGARVATRSSASRPTSSGAPSATRAEINANPQAARHAFEVEEASTLDSLRALLDRSRIELPAEPAADRRRRHRLHGL